MRKSILLLSLTVLSLFSFAGSVTGLVTDDKGKSLPYASISIKGTTKGTTANGSGKYSISLTPGDYTLICQYVGYGRIEKKISVTADDQVINFSLSIQELTLGEVIVKKGEDPAYEIIRQAIKKREYYNTQVDSFSVEVYIKGLMRSRKIPSKVMGQKVDRDASDGLDSAGRGILFLSESVTKVAYKKPGKLKYQVISSRQSGGGFGLSFPFFINFYQNNVQVFNNTFNPRGFVSPIADGALNYYKYKYEGSFFDEGKMVNTITVIPKRKGEPLFSGTIQIVEDDWRIYSVDMLTTSAYQLELIDSLRISQIHSPVTSDVWKTKNQVVYVAANIFAFDFTGNFVNVYTDYNLNPGFSKKYFDRVIMKYDTAFNKKDTNYWNKTRPVALETDEKRNYVFKDSVSKIMRDSFLTKRNIDSLRVARKPITIKKIFWSGVSHNFYSHTAVKTYSLEPILKKLQYNTVEGISLHVNQSFYIRPVKSMYTYKFDWNTQYGSSNTHLNSYANLTIQNKKPYPQFQRLVLSGGKRLSQFNKDEPISPLANEAYTLLGKRNYMKLYENWFGYAGFYNRYDNGLSWQVYVNYENRIPVENTTDFSFFNKSDSLLPNHPYELATIPFNKHQALEAGLSLTWQPGQRYIEFPWGKVPLGSSYPTFQLEYTKGINKLFGSDVDFDKWKFTVFDDVDLKLRGLFKYRLSIGGFFNSNKVEIPDLQHFNGNRTIANKRYLNSFQLAPYYQYSNAE
ncbi:MAG: DUF5686 and carboxypeptidase regulatory-like domain-containing protein, partial [Chitinophagaceae bacterium]